MLPKKAAQRANAFMNFAPIIFIDSTLDNVSLWGNETALLLGKEGSGGTLIQW
jgi:hypothetical protein